MRDMSYHGGRSRQERGIPCCHLSSHFFDRSKEPVLISFVHPLHPENCQRYDDESRSFPRASAHPGGTHSAQPRLGNRTPHFRPRSTSYFGPFSTPTASSSISPRTFATLCHTRALPCCAPIPRFILFRRLLFCYPLGQRMW